MNQDNEEIVLGSGDFYGMIFSGSIPDDLTIETDANNFGHTKGGASIEYKPSIYEATDDNNHVLKRIITKEEGTLKCGTMSINLANIAKMAPSTLVNDTDRHERILKIGGKTSLQSYVLRFVHPKDDGTKLRVTIVGNATSGFTFQFNPDKETTVEPTFSALSQDDGTLIEFRDGYQPTTPQDALKLMTSTPADGATGIALNSRIVLTFNNVIQNYSGIILINNSDNSLVETSLSVDGTGKVVSIIPKSAFVAGKEYDVIMNGVTDINGSVLSAQIIKFATATA